MKLSISTSLVLSLLFLCIGFFTFRNKSSVHRRLNEKVSEELSLLERKQRKGTNKAMINDKEVKNIYKTEERKDSGASKIGWSDVVIVMLIYDRYSVNELIQANFGTWMKRTGAGLDIVFVTDANDGRTANEILPNAGNIEANVHICRSKKMQDGKRARAKVMDALFYVYDKFKDSDKKMFLKLDPDAYIRSERLLQAMNKVYAIAGDKPVDFGYALCQTESCYSEGGLYGMSKEGLRLSLECIQTHPNLFTDFIPSIVDGSKNLLGHEDYFTSYVFWKATQYPVMHLSDISVNFVTKQRTSNSPVSIHPVKSAKDYYVLDMVYYDDKGFPRNPSSSSKLFLPLKNLFEFTHLRWNYQDETYTAEGEKN